MLLSRKVKEQFPEVLRDKPVELLFCGTAAVYHSIRTLHLNESDVVLMPDYNCGIEVNAVLEAGARVEFYRVRRDGLIDLVDLDNKARPPVKVIYVIHYFGFSQTMEPLVRIARDRGMLVIEDCAHSLYSKYEGNHVGVAGDIAIFSPRKTLPLMDGGVLLNNLSKVGESELLLAPEWAHTAREFLYSLSRYGARSRNLLLCGMGRFLRIVTRLIDWRTQMEKPLSEVGSEDFDSVKHRLNWHMSSLSQVLLKSIDHDEVIRKRRKNFFYLLKNLASSNSMTPLYNYLPDGICPLYFPLLIPQRDRVYEYMRSHRIGVFQYWLWKHPNIVGEIDSDAEFLRRQLMCLPVHQDLEEKDLSILVNSLKECAEVSGSFSGEKL
jgi:dTDP-4-amino-4,6-dideoxygalactose transaminase